MDLLVFGKSLLDADADYSKGWLGCVSWNDCTL